MRKQITLAEAEGRPIAGYVRGLGSLFALLVGKDAAVILAASRDYCGGITIDEFGDELPMRHVYCEFDRDQAAKAGLLDIDELRREEEETAAKRAAADEELERATYQRLKAKFEGKP
jgi:hypothetical protein